MVKLFFDQLHHVTTNEVSLIDALELMVFCNHQGQMDMKSEFETRLYRDLSDQILAEIKDSKELCFVWMFLRSRGPSGRDKNACNVKNSGGVFSDGYMIYRISLVHSRILGYVY